MIYDDKKFIGQVIRNARKKAKMSQAQLSELIDMCDKNLGNIENGKQFPQVNNFLKIIETLNIPLAEFGVEKEANKINNVKNELFKKIYSTSDNKANIYLDTLNFIDNILKTNV